MDLKISRKICRTRCQTLYFHRGGKIQEFFCHSDLRGINFGNLEITEIYYHGKKFVKSTFLLKSKEDTKELISRNFLSVIAFFCTFPYFDSVKTLLSRNSHSVPKVQN